MGKKLLVIDDNIEIGNVISDLLGDLFEEVVRVETVEEASEQLELNTFSFIILDINLEGRNGGEIIKFLSSKPENPNNKAPFIIVSGIVNPNFVERNIQKFAGILAKPFDHSELRTITEKGLKIQTDEAINSIIAELAF